MNKTEYLLCCLTEELSEVQQEIGKCLRFTCNHKPTEYPTTNIQRVALEMADVYAITTMLYGEGVDVGIAVPYDDDMTESQRVRMQEKILRTNKLMDISKELGALNVSAD
jgi:hypothetical protein